MKKRILLWFNRDLRIVNNRMLEDLDVSNMDILAIVFRSIEISSVSSEQQFVVSNLQNRFWTECVQDLHAKLALGGENSALEHLHEYVWNAQSIKHYIQTRNGLINKSDSTKFSPWLAWGCISPLQVMQQVFSAGHILGSPPC